MLRGVLSARARQDEAGEPSEIPDPLARNRRERRLAWLLLLLLAGAVWAAGWMAERPAFTTASPPVERAP
ncbi:MAG: hypothetical protein KF886_19275 [Candidatus Hydrogenedentes bacterium]|nr:hypothetical protein [Candidatus Hydrogenedentota bacterium]